MKVAVFSTKPYDEQFLSQAKKIRGEKHELKFIDVPLNKHTAVLAEGFPCICTFVNDVLNEEVMGLLHQHGVRFIALRCAGFNNVDFYAAQKQGLIVGRVPAYSPYSIAEHTIGLMLALSRKICRAYTRTRDGNFSIDGLMGFDLHKKTLGVVGTGKIGAITAKFMTAFEGRVVAHDLYENEQLKKCGVEYLSLDDLFKCVDVMTLHCPLTDDSYHMINSKSLEKMKDGVMIVNTSRGALINSEDAIGGLKSGKIGALGLDVYEEEANLFFEDYSDKVIPDDVIARILSFPNVVVTSHQAYFTIEAMKGIVEMTFDNINAFESGATPPGLINWEMLKKK